MVVGFTIYLSESFLRRNPIAADRRPARCSTSTWRSSSRIAGEAKHQFPINVPQVAGEPLHYHWFGFAHMGAASLVSGVDLPTVFLRLAMPALCALAASC